MTEHPVFNTMDEYSKFTGRLPYYIIAIGIVWGICLGIIWRIFGG